MRCRSGEIELGRRKVVMRSFGEMEFVGVEGGFERNKWHFWRRRSSKWRSSFEREELKVEKKQF